MEDLLYAGVMAVTGSYLGYEALSEIRWEPQGRQEVRDMDEIDTRKIEEEIEEYFQSIDQRGYELSEYGLPFGDAWAEMEAVLTHPVEHARYKGRREQIEKSKELAERLQPTLKSPE